MVNLRFGATSLLSLASVASLGAAERKDVSAWGRDQERPHPSIPWKNPLNDHIYLSKLIVQMDQEIQGTQVTIGPEIVQFQVQTIGGDGDKNEFARVFCRMPLDCTAHKTNPTGWVEYNKAGKDIPCLGSHTMRIRAGSFCENHKYSMADYKVFEDMEFEYSFDKQTINVLDNCTIANGKGLDKREANAHCEFGTNLKTWSQEEGFAGQHADDIR